MSSNYGVLFLHVRQIFHPLGYLLGRESHQNDVIIQHLVHRHVQNFVHGETECGVYLAFQYLVKPPYEILIIVWFYPLQFIELLVWNLWQHRKYGSYGFSKLGGQYPIYLIEHVKVLIVGLVYDVEYAIGGWLGRQSIQLVYLQLAQSES